MNHRKPTIPMLLMTLLVVGCESSDERLMRFVEESHARQAQQNHVVTELNREAVESHRRVVEAVEQSRQDVAALERDVQQQRERLEEERRQLAVVRERDSLLVPAVESAGLLLLCSLPLILAWYLLHGLRNQHDEEVSELLIQELAGEAPSLLQTSPPEPSPPRLPRDASEGPSPP